ncbi:MAG TPA: FtsX-like permease family protein [Steroidobacteraceae bacterium]|nr:FtsX-like permease family protein [Steroidobacteraceae bacterium]
MIGAVGKYLPLLAASLRRKRLRTFFTIASIVVAFLLFGLAESMRFALRSGVEVAGADRLLTMHKVSFTQLLPASYENRIKAVDGVVAITPQTWFGAWFQDERNQIPTFPTKPEAFLRIYPEIQVPEAEEQAWIADRAGILVGRSIATLFGWKVGDTVPLKSAIWRREDGSDTWDVTVRAIFDMAQGGDTRQIVMHQEYFEEAKQQAKGLIGWYVIRVDDVDHAQAVARQIDALFANSPAETKTSSERAMAQSFVNQIGNIGAILSAIVAAVFFTMLLVTANTMAQSVRERTNELGVLKTLGFSNPGVLGLVLGESMLVTTLGGVAGMVLAWYVGVQFEPVLDQYLPGFRVPPSAFVQALAIMLALGAVAGAAPAWQAMRLRIVDALRRE